MTWEIEVFKSHISFYLVDANDIVQRRVSIPRITLGM